MIWRRTEGESDLGILHYRNRGHTRIPSLLNCIQGRETGCKQGVETTHYESTDYEYHLNVFVSHPRAFRDSKVLDERRAMLEAVRPVQPLRTWAADLARSRNAVVPQFDPAEAGTEAKVLLLFEAPGPMANMDGQRPGSGFISVDNNDATAENLWRARTEAGLDDGVLCWNIVPWYLGVASRKPTMSELRAGAHALQGLLLLLPELHTVVASGRFAQRGWREYARPGSSITVRTIDAWHPSPLSMNQPNHRAEFVAALRRAGQDWPAAPRKDSIELQFDRDRDGRSVAGWYVDDAGDRIDVHPRWWNSPFS